MMITLDSSLDLKRINNKTCGKFKRAKTFFFSQVMFSFDRFYIIQSNQQQVLHPRIWISGGVLRWSEIPNQKRKTQPTTNPHQRFQSGRSRDWGCILLRNSATMAAVAFFYNCLKESIQRHPSFNVQRLLKDRSCGGKILENKKDVLDMHCMSYCIWFVCSSWKSEKNTDGWTSTGFWSTAKLLQGSMP